MTVDIMCLAGDVNVTFLPVTGIVL